MLAYTHGMCSDRPARMTFAYMLRGNKIYPVDHVEPGKMSIIAGDGNNTFRVNQLRAFQ